MNWQELEQRKKQMEEEILSLIESNQQILEDSKISWESKVYNQIPSIHSSFFLSS